MAIFGTLTEIPLLELLPTLTRRTGKLSIVVLPQKRSYYLYLDKERLKALYIDKQALLNGVLIRQAFIELFKAKDGHYTFKPISIEVLPKSFDVPLKPLLNTTSEDKVFKDRLPTPQTKFILSEPKQRELEPWQSNYLKEFWKSTILLFDKGSSALEVARALSIDVRTAQLNIYKLRTLGQISPMRSFEDKFSSDVPETPYRKSSQEQDYIGSTFVEDMSRLSYREIIKRLRETEQTPLLEPLDRIKLPLSSQSSSSHNKELINHLLKVLKH